MATAVGVLGWLAMPANAQVVGDGSVRIGRYSTQQAAPVASASDPLTVFATITFPRQQVRTVGDAVRHTLLRTGWQLVDVAALSPEAARFLALPLPESQRVLGPYRVQDILDLLLGTTWQWHHDPVQRRLWFTVTPAYAQLTQASPAEASAGAASQAVADRDARSAPGVPLDTAPANAKEARDAAAR
ncbi:hypothetical protein [Acidovorax sp. SUPP2825]|uniref:PFGI-1 class ICE element type IV pilus protein PilL2 n=1 Tax=Acidovorax sp. SUPP2825 TaxID=2920879 RepID=UPI0023DE3088|nr:hypothetical protein [Acidovorax sp. SUPP2825]GKS95611.1 hypothetical protein AVAK2825_13770 [Acidovorax sp. SUPP2825]